MRVQVASTLGVIAAALDLVPERIRRLSECDWVVGVDPVFIGAHPFETTTDGRSYRVTACQVPERWSLDHRSTICLPTPDTVTTVIHELGHVLHERLGWRATVAPVTAYAQTNHLEAFAEAFTAWMDSPGYEQIYPSPFASALFDELAETGTALGVGVPA